MGGIINIVDQTITSKDFEGNNFNIGLERQSVNMGTSGSFSYKGNVNDVNLTYALKEVNFESYDVPSGAIIHEGKAEAEESLANSDLATTSHKLGTSIVRDWGYFGFSLADIENTYGIAFHEEEEENPVPGAPVEEHDDRIKVDTSSTNLTIEGASTNISALDKLSYFLQANDYEFTESHIEEGVVEESTTFTNESFEVGLKFDIGNQASGNRQNVTLNLSEEDVSIKPSDANEEPFMKPVDSQMLSFGYFLCRELEVMDLDFGLRLDQVNRDGSIDNTLYDISESNLSTAITMGWDVANNVDITLGISSVARAPSEIELFMNGTHLAAGRNEKGNVNLESERSNNLDFSVGYENNGYFVNASVYANAVDDYIYIKDRGTETNKRPDVDYAQADADFNGYEFEVGRSFSTNNGELQISYGREEVVGTFASGGNVPRITPIKNVYRFAFEQRDVTYDIKIMDVQKEDDIDPSESETDGYTMVDFDIRRSIAIGNDEELVLSVFGRNLMDEKARNHTSYVKNEVPLAGRNFGIKLNFNF
jgi:iron complex outermembrane receptor protein